MGNNPEKLEALKAKLKGNPRRRLCSIVSATQKALSGFIARCTAKTSLAKRLIKSSLIE